MNTLRIATASIASRTSARVALNSRLISTRAQASVKTPSAAKTLAGLFLLSGAAVLTAGQEKECSGGPTTFTKMSDAEMVKRILEIKTENPDNIMAACFDLNYYNSLPSQLQSKFLKCLASGTYNSDSSMGCYATMPDDYETFKPFFKAALEKYHKVDLSKTKHVNNWSLKGVAGLPASGVLDLADLGLPPLSMRVRTGRNLKQFPLPASMTKRDRVAMELAMGEVFSKLIADPAFGGRYVSITPGHPNFIDEAEYNKLVKAHIMFKDMSADPYLLTAGIAEDWPYGRGCYISEDKGFIIWVGEEDHLRIMCMQKGNILNKVFDRLKAAIDVVEELIPGGCAYSPDFGVVTSCPTNIGTGMRASVHIQLPNLTADGTDARAKAVAKPLGLSVRGVGGEHTPIGADGTVDISPSARFCISEAEIVTALYNGIKLLKEKEDEAGGAAAGGADAQLLAAQEALLAAQKAVLEVQKLMAKKN
uniref:Arginine kinase n=2 Tax=Heterosigma akashiwo TaxID=2829 RepID=A0A7S4DCK0_HETAK|mmetsp:Transcript_11466/g.18359  ORF Transcript_11466/g.18359 Transcript_11466/m.18359 type:complete len:478 (+) Transcript_11466:67-1500(+)